MTTTKHPEPSTQQLQAALERLAAAAPGIWPRTLGELGKNAAKLVRARALQSMTEADRRRRTQPELAFPPTPDEGATR